jgi:hypothetical protein
LWKKSYDELDTQKASAKQSQFPHGRQWPSPAWLPVPLAGPVVQTKPIPPVAKRRASTWWKKSYDE